MHPNKIVIKLSHENMTSRVYSFPNDSKLLSNLFVGSITVVFQVVKCGKKVVWHFSIFCLNHYSYRGSYPSIKLHLRWSNLYENWSEVLHISLCQLFPEIRQKCQNFLQKFWGREFKTWWRFETIWMKDVRRRKGWAK